MCDGDTGKDNGPVASEFRVRARFYAIRQVNGERAYDWYMRVRAAAVPCGFPSADQRTSAVADKFVTGLQPGPVADSLLDMSADGRLEDLLAVAVAVERANEVPVERENEILSIPVTRTKDVIAEIREGLKLYQYSSTEYESGFDSDASNDSNHKLPPIQNDKLISNTKSKFSESSEWKNKTELNNKQSEIPAKNYSPSTCKSCCHLATKLLECFKEITPAFHQLDSNEDKKKNINMNYQIDYHDNSKCYCSMFTANK